MDLRTVSIIVSLVAAVGMTGCEASDSSPSGTDASTESPPADASSSSSDAPSGSGDGPGEVDLGPCEDLAACAAAADTPVTPLIALYGEDGTCWAEFGQEACWLDCRAQKKAFSEISGSDPACRECQTDDDCALWGPELACGSDFECFDPSVAASICARVVECCGGDFCVDAPTLPVDVDVCEAQLLFYADGCDSELVAIAECSSNLDCDTFPTWLNAALTSGTPEVCESVTYDWFDCVF